MEKKLSIKEKYFIGKYIKLREKNEFLKQKYNTKDLEIDDVIRTNYNKIVYDLAIYRFEKSKEPREKFPEYCEKAKKELANIYENRNKENTRTYNAARFFEIAWQVLKIVAIVLFIPFVILFLIIKALTDAGLSETRKDHKSDDF